MLVAEASRGPYGMCYNRQRRYMGGRLIYRQALFMVFK